MELAYYGATVHASSPEGDLLPTRQIFVGREAELGQLRSAFEGVIAGRGWLTALPGEPGIGKTTLCEQLMEYVATRGGRALVGHSYEEGSQSLPYMPFVEALRGYVLDRDAAALEAELGASASDLARIVPEILDKLQVQVRPAGDPEDDRWRLLQAVSSFLRNVSTSNPLLLVLEDLHDADRGTLDLLLHLARNLAGSRLLVIATYRDVEVDRAHPLSAALAELRRSASFSRLPLRGLSVDEVHRLYCLVRGQDVPRSRSEAVHRRTEGNPLFVQEVLRYTVEAGIVVRQGDRYLRTDDGAADGGIPEGLRDVIGKRLSRLSVACNRLLSIAAVIGRDFDLTVLESVAAMDEEALSAGLEEGLRVGVLQEHTRPGSVRYRFAHAFFRQTLYEELIAPRRLRLHQQVARAIEQRNAGRLEEHAAELAEHFAHSTDAADLRKAIHYAEVAARQALSVYAYSEAARILEHALQVHDVLDSNDPAWRCDLLLQLGDALIPAGEPQHAAEDIAPQAFSLADALGDARRASRASQLALEGMLRYGGAALERSPTFREWAERADRYAAPQSVERVYADHALGNYLALVNEEAQAAVVLDRALALARELGDGEALFRSAWKLLMWTQFPSRQTQLLRIAEEFRAYPREGVNHRTLGSFLHYALLTYLAHADREHFEDLGREVAELAERTRDPALVWRPLVFEVILRTLDGELEQAVEAAAKFVERGHELGIGVLARGQSYGWRAQAHLYLGLDDAEAVGFLTQHGYEVVVGPLQIARGQRAEARAGLYRFLSDRRARTDQQQIAVYYLLPGLATAVLLEDREQVERLARWLMPASGCVGGPPASWGIFTTFARVLGEAAIFLGDRSAARAYFDQALEVASRLRFRPELAVIRLCLAELLVGDPNVASRSEGRAHLESAIVELRAMHMQPYLERALVLQQKERSEGSQPTDVLSVREREVANLVARGLSNRAIAEALVITEGTAEVHVKRILAKLGFRSRSQVAAWVVQHEVRRWDP